MGNVKGRFNGFEQNLGAKCKQRRPVPEIQEIEEKKNGQENDENIITSF